jgi:hypothetical protein
MAIELSYQNFNNGDDIVPRYSAEEVIFNTGITKTLAGDDRITGVGPGMRSSIYSSGFINYSTLEMAEGNDMITGTYDATEYSLHNANYAIFDNGRSIYRDNAGDFYYYPEDPDGPIPLPVNNYGIYNDGTIDTGIGDDTITGSNITESGYLIDITLTPVGYTRSSVGIYNGNTIKTGEGADSLISDGKLINYGGVFLEDGNDTITTYGVIYNDGEIITGNGNDSIIAHGGFESSLNNTGSVSLGNDEDYLNGFGKGTFNGGNGNDILKLTPGSYTVGIWGESTTFTKGNSLMITLKFEQLIAGDIPYDFSTLTHGQIINVSW